MAGERAAWAAWGLAAAFYVVALFHRMSLGVASLDATARFDLAPGTIATLSALQLGLYLAMTIPAGVATDRIGPRRALALGLAAMAAGEIAFGLATSAPLALGGRALVGAGDAFIFLSVLRVAQNWFPASRYALLASLTGLAGALGQLGTTIPLGLSLEGIGWSATFVGSGLLTAGLAVACLALLRDRPAGAPAADAARRAGIGRTLRACWARPATRRTFWLHFGLMGPFVAITALWGYPYLVESQGVAPGTARAWLLLTVVMFGAAAPLMGLVASRTSRERVGALMLGQVAALTGLWAPALLWPAGAPPHALLVAALAMTGVCGGAAMLSFDFARAGNPAGEGGTATGLANTGGFSAAVIAQLAVGRVLAMSPADGLQTALLPLLGLMILGCVQIARHGRRARRLVYAPPSATMPTPAARIATPTT
jgi:predicted MFS family arabinose efflux permease